MRLNLVVLFALLVHWKLSHIVLNLRAQPEAVALCKWNRDIDAISEAIGLSTRTCTWLLAGPYGRQGELWTIVGHAVRWLDDSVLILAGQT